MMTNDRKIILRFQQGTLLAEGDPSQLKALDAFVYDPRSTEFRAKAIDYREIILSLRSRNWAYEDQAKAYDILNPSFKKTLALRPYQNAAIQSWLNSEKRGVIALPTGAGKTIVAVAAIAEAKRSCLVVVPTIDLLYQWRKVLEDHFHFTIGLLGDGNKETGPVTVSTYDSARLTIEGLGNKFGLIIFDECHHLPAPQYQFIALCALAPYRLGLSATVQRADGKESLIYELLGPLVYEGKITDLVSRSLAPYDVVNLEVDLSPKEREAYTAAREKYLNFIQRNRIDFSQRDAWKKFLFLSSRSKVGREAFLAHRSQKLIAQRAEKKMEVVWDLLVQHTQDQMIIFTDDNETAYRIGSCFMLPVITHKTKDRERRKFLDGFRDGSLRILVTSRVLNEGVDVPEASVGVIVSGTGAVREHVQRLGRILRPRPGKRAVLYELVARATNEVFVNQRRRQHDAYEDPVEN